MAPFHRASRAGWALVVGLAACGPSPQVKAPHAATTCDGPRLRACERDLQQAVRAGKVQAPLIAAYVKAREAQDASDPWAKLWAGLSDRKGAQAAIVDARAGEAAAAAGARVVHVAPLPEPGEATAAELVLAMATAAGYEHLVWLGAGRDGKRAYEVYPHDPLQPLVLGLPGIVASDAMNDRVHGVAKSLALAAAVRRVLDAAGSFRYVDAAKDAAQLAVYIDGRDPFAEPVLRARYVRSLLSGAGLVLEPPSKIFGDDALPADAKLPAAPAPGELDTPYGDLLRVRLADDGAAEWKRRGPRVLAAIADDRKPLADKLFGPPLACGEALVAPSFDRPGDLPFAYLLPGALAGAREEALSSASGSAGLPLSQWYPRYEALVGLVDQTRLGWLQIGGLLRQRGELAGITSVGSPTYRRVTELGLRHLRALRELSDSDPENYTASAEVPLAYSPGLLSDEALRTALIELTQATTKSKLARATEPDAIAGSLLASALTGMTYAPSIQSAHYLALQSAFTAKVKGELSQKTGWGTAALFAADAIFRVLAEQGPNLAFSSDQIVRALSDPKIELPNVAAVVAAVARYAALAKDKPLSALVKPAQFTPERGAAREALRKAIVDMGGPGEAPVSLSDDLATLADGLIATATIVAHRKPPPAGTCADSAKSAADIELEHALTRLREVRQKILQSPRFKTGDGLWARRARLLVTILSDAMDFVAPAKSGAPKPLTLTAADVERAVTGALREWNEPGARDALIGTYSLARLLLSRDSTTGLQSGGPYLIRALGGIGRFLRGSSASDGTRLLDALAEMAGKEAGATDLMGALVGYAKAFYDRGKPDQGDVFLLATLLITSARRVAPPPEAIVLAAAQKSRIEWALALFAEVAAAESTGRPNVQAYAAGVQKAAAAQCAVGRVSDVLDVMGAVAQFSSGQRKEARAALDAVLARADAEGLVVPKLHYQYEEKHDKKVFTLSFGFTYGLGFVEGANTFQIGLGISSIAGRASKLGVSAKSPEETASEAARYYVRTAALAAAYHFLDGDTASAAIAARRAVSAVVMGVRLGPRAVTRDRNRWAEDARALLAVDAQLAAEAGLPFLAGDLWTVVKDSLPPDADDARVTAVLAPPPLGLAALKDAEGPLERTRKSLRVVAAPLSCTAAKVDTAGFEEAACAGYPLAISLRIADVLKKMPRLKKSADSGQGSCAALKSLDAFLSGADRAAYDPDAFTRAVEDFRTGGRADEAAALMARQRRDAHCSPTLLKAARALGRSPALLPSARADMLAIAVNCAGADGGSDLEKDLLALDEETRKLADPMRNLKLLLFVGDLALRANKPNLLLPLVRDPHYLDRFLHLHGNAVAGALLLHHTAHLLAGEAFDPAPSEGPYALVCTSFPADDRRAECDDLKALRDPSKPAADRQKLAKDALARLLAPKTPAKPRTK